MKRDEFYYEACLRAMEGLLAASGHYREELIKNPCEYVATSAVQYAMELTEMVYGVEQVFNKQDMLLYTNQTNIT